MLPALTSVRSNTILWAFGGYPEPGMKALVADLSPARVLFTQLLRRLGRAPHFGPLSVIRERELATPSSLPPGSVRVRNRYAGICGSDLHFVLGEGDFRVAPVAVAGATAEFNYMGHEIVGTVTEVGPGVTRLKPGDRVVHYRGGANCLAFSREQPCRQCSVGNYNLCEAPREDLSDDSSGGGWSQEHVAPEGRLFPIPDDISDENAVLIEPAGSALRAVLRRTPQPREKVLIIGQGTQGLATLQSVRALQPDCHVSVVARFPFQAEMSRRFGAHEVIMAGTDLYEAAARLSGGRVYRGMFGNRALLGGFDVVYDCVGIPATLKDALRLARARGTVVLVGVYLAPMHIDLTPTWYWEVDLIGVLAHGGEDWEGERLSTFDVLARLLQEGRLDLEPLITHRFPLSRWREAIATAIHQERSHSIKVVFDHGDGRAPRPEGSAGLTPKPRPKAAER